MNDANYYLNIITKGFYFTGIGKSGVILDTEYYAEKPSAEIDGMVELIEIDREI
jgi:hypothetical protein